VVVEDPPLPPLPPRRFAIRVEIGPVDGPFRTSDIDLISGSVDFTVPAAGGRPGSTRAGDVLLPGDRGLDRPNEARPDVQWICRVTNREDEALVVDIRVFFSLSRRVLVTEIPRSRLTTIFEGALNWLIPVVGVRFNSVQVGLQPEAGEVIGVAPTIVPIEGVDLTGIDIGMTAFRFDIITPDRFFRDCFEDLQRALGDDPDVPGDFVDRMVDAAIRGGRGDLRELAANLWDSGLAGDFERLIVNANFARLDIPTVTPAEGFGSFPDDLVLRAVLTVDSIQADGNIAIGTAEASIDKISVTVDALIGTFSYFDRHPIAKLPDHPLHAEYERQLTTATRTTLLTRFRANVDGFEFDIDADAPGTEVAVETVLAIGDAVNKLPDDETIEDLLEEAGREFLTEQRAVVRERINRVVMEVANRAHALHDIRLHDDDLVIETYEPVPVRQFSLPRIRRDLLEPIDGPMSPEADARLGDIEHIVVVTMENRSFDHMLGYLSHPDPAVQAAGPRPDIDGLTGAEVVPPETGGEGDIPVRPVVDVEFRPDPAHDFASVRAQIAAGAMTGFIGSFGARIRGSEEINASADQRLGDVSRIVTFHRSVDVPMNDYVAAEFMVLDRYFCAFPGGTQPNRICMLAGRTPELTNDEISRDLGYLRVRTLFDALDEARVAWRYYEGDIGFVRMFDRFRVDFERVRPLDEFLRGGSRALAPVTFIDPNFKETPSADGANDDHAPTPVMRGQALLASVIRRVRRSRSWSRAMLVITYDEHGGFYDHVAPPGTPVFAAANPAVASPISRVHPSAATFGVRVPALVVSPRVPRGGARHEIYDHTSITRTIVQRFAPNVLPLMPERVRRARHLGELLASEVRASIRATPTVDASAVAPRRLRLGDETSPIQWGASSPEYGDERILIQTLGIPRTGA
jgi:phospholipase C